MESFLNNKIYIKTSYNVYLIIIFSTIIVTYLHYSIPMGFHFIHILHYYLYYLIVIYTAIKTGFLGGIVCALIISFLYDYEVYLYLFEMPHFKIRTFVEIIMLYTVGAFTGYFSQRLYLDNLKLKETKEELAKSLNDLKKHIEEKSKMENELSRLDRLRLMGQVSASIAHEVRNPLSAIKSAAKFLKDTYENNEIIDIILKESEQLERFINKFNQFIRKSDIQKEKLSISAFMEELKEYIKMYLKDKKVDYSIKIDCNIDEITTDKIALKHILLNLIINAFEAVEGKDDGKVLIAAKQEGGYLYFSVWDNGIGIKEDDKDKIFEPFYTNKKDGTGLGLSIALKLAAELGGQITLDDSNGTNFSLRLPI